MQTVDCVCIEAGKILLIKRAKPPFKHHWCLPGGKVEEGEDFENAALRELEEETGYRGVITKELTLIESAWRDPRYRDSKAQPYSVRIIGYNPRKEDSGVLEAKWFALSNEGGVYDEAGNPVPVGFDHLRIIQEAI